MPSVAANSAQIHQVLHESADPERLHEPEGETNAGGRHRGTAGLTARLGKQNKFLQRQLRMWEWRAL